ncbi:ROK family protein [Angelakisella massiliensis]|uniref:ROK family protein n=2 Tax=Angelakisella massiliensis TaxID=1871018 RepID=UPI0022875E4B|nr:ROK family protein [Angelakisella massiliensis]
MLFQLCHGTKEEMTGKLPFDAMDKGDPQAREVVENYIRCLGEGITNLVNIFRPQVVLLSGGVSAQGQRLTAPLEEYLGRYAFAGKHLNIPPIRCAALGNDAGIIGAAHLGTDEVG